MSRRTLRTILRPRRFGAPLWHGGASRPGATTKSHGFPPRNWLDGLAIPLPSTRARFDMRRPAMRAGPGRWPCCFSSPKQLHGGSAGERSRSVMRVLRDDAGPGGRTSAGLRRVRRRLAVAQLLEGCALGFAIGAAIAGAGRVAGWSTASAAIGCAVAACLVTLGWLAARRPKRSERAAAMAAERACPDCR